MFVEEGSAIRQLLCRWSRYPRSNVQDLLGLWES